ncbi:MAG: FGGY-family carbohydrate kinase [Suipraeoptans sp.]
MSKYILAIDQSTTGTKGVLFNEKAEIVSSKSLIHKQYYPNPGHVEQDAEEIFNQTKTILYEMFNSVSANDDILALAITVQTGAFVLWDKHTGIPIHNIIGWHCNRGETCCSKLSSSQKSIIIEKSGTDASAYLPAAKLGWLFENYTGLLDEALEGNILFGTIETWLIWKLTNGKVHASDYCNASITQLFNQNTLAWDHELLEIFGVPKSIPPELMDADANYGNINIPGLPSTPITGVIGDSAAALFGQCGFNVGDMKITYGTGSSILMNLGDRPHSPANGMTTSVGWRINGKISYVWEGTAVCTGAVISWLVNDLELLDDAAQSEEVAAMVEDSEGVYLVPAFSGLGTPYRDSNARACIVNMSTGTKRPHIVRAALDCIAYQIKDMVNTIEQQTNEKIPCLLVDGGVTRNKLLMQFQSDILGIPILRSQAEESSALGVFYAAGLAVGLFENQDFLYNLGKKRQHFEPNMSYERIDSLYAGWQKAIEQARLK